MAAVYMIGPACVAIAIALTAVGAFALRLSSNGLVLRGSAPAARALEMAGVVWYALGAGVLWIAWFRQRAFLREARIVEGVVRSGKIEVSIDGTFYRTTALGPPVADGTRAAVFARGARVAALAKAGARIDPDGRFSWDATAYPYPRDPWPWLVGGVVGGVAVVASALVAVCAGAF